MCSLRRPILLATLLLLLCADICHAAGASQTKKTVPGQLIEIFFAELCSKGCSEEDRARWKENFRWEFHDLNGDSTAEYFLYVDHADWCGAGGSNCTYWIYQESQGAYKLLLEAPRLAPMKSITKGYRDLYGDFRMGATGVRGKFEYYRTIYKFDGKKYKQVSGRSVYKND